MLSLNKHIWLYFLLLFMGFTNIKAQNIEVIITDIRSIQGQIIIGIYKDEQSFKDDMPFLRKKFEKNTVSNGELKVNLSLSPGTYGFALLDDENSDDKMNYSIVGIPKEGFGFSNYYNNSLTRPKFDVFKFEVQENQNQKIFCKIKYM